MLRIKDWLLRFEAKREKDRPSNRMEWIRVPCDQQSEGYVMLMSQADGAQHLGVFLSLVELVANLPREVRDGRLVNRDGTELSLQVLSMKTRIPEDVLSPSIEALRRVGWLRSEAGLQELPGNSRLEEIREEEKRGDNISSPDGECNDDSLDNTSSKTSPPRKKNDDSLLDGWFETFWSAYWRKAARAVALKAFRRAVKTEQQFQEIMAAVEAQTPEMMRRAEQHRPHAASWLNGERWLDEPAPADSEGTPPVI